MEDKRIQWQPLIEMIVVLMTILGSTIPLYIHTDSKLETSLQSMREDLKTIHSETRAQISAIHEEIKDFHGKLCAIEERNKA